MTNRNCHFSEKVLCFVTWLQLNAEEDSAVVACSSERFAVPDSLVHHFVIVPSKLRLVTLAAFLMGKCRVSLRDYCLHTSRKVS